MLAFALARRPAPRLFSSLPWFVDSKHAQSHPNPPLVNAPPLPDDAPDVLKDLRSDLLKLPHLESSSVLVSRPVTPPPAPPLPNKAPQGRRRRAGNNSGESFYDGDITGIWNWVLLAQVKQGTENRGAIESVVRVVRKSLLLREPPIPLPPNHKRQLHNGWAMVDGGDFAVHILSKDARDSPPSEYKLQCFPRSLILSETHPAHYPTNPSPHCTMEPLASNLVSPQKPKGRRASAGHPHETESEREARRMMRKTAGVVEARPGIIESTHIDPLNDDPNKDDTASAMLIGRQ